MKEFLSLSRKKNEINLDIESIARLLKSLIKKRTRFLSFPLVTSHRVFFMFAETVNYLPEVAWDEINEIYKLI